MLNNQVYDIVKKEALTHNLEPALLLAVVSIESSGTAFWNVNGQNKPVIRFEGHYFYARLKGDELATAIKQGLASKKAGAIKNPPNGAGVYALLDRAIAINRNAALESCSWGLGQVMGANWQYLKYNSVEELVNAANTIEGQIDMIFRFIEDNNLIAKLRNKDWRGFAKVYNGPNYGSYATKLQAAYNSYLKTPSSVDGGVATSEETIQMQRMLNSVGPYKLKEDGSVGVNTKAALKDFQLKNGLVADGIYGKLTKEKLESAYLEKAKKGQGQLGAGTAGIGVAGTAISNAADQVQMFAGYSNIIQYVFIALVVIGVGITIYSLVKKVQS